MDRYTDEENTSRDQSVDAGWTPRANPSTSPREELDPRGPVGRRVWLRALAVVLVVVLLAAGAALMYARFSLRRAAVAALPQVDGQQAVAGLGTAVTVARDAQGVPHLEATTLDDLVYAQAFVTASDRLFQMDMLRRYAAGELAEVLGSNLLAHDKLQRVLLLRRSAENALAALPADQRHLLEVYAGGVNAAIDAGHLPVEFTALHYKPAAWRPVDSMLVGVAMFEDLTTAYPTKIAREALSAKLPPELAADLYPVGSWRDHPPASAVPDLTIEGPPIEQVPLDESQSSLLAPPRPGSTAAADPCSDCWPGSNNWAIAGTHTASGKPLLANDMHLTHNLPGVWYEVGLKTPLPGAAEGLDVAGVSLPGIPLVVVGHNRHVAWGFTVLGADVQDVYLETLRGQGAGQQFQASSGEWSPVLHLPETIRVRGGKDVTLDVTATRHGDTTTPILNPIFDPTLVAGRTLALRWTLYDPGVLALPVLAIGTAHDWASFGKAFSTFGGPGQNVVYADDQGHIGYHAVGFVPLRGAGDRADSAASQLPPDIQTPVEPRTANRTPPASKTANPLAGTALQAPPPPLTPQLSGPLSEVPLVATPQREWSGYIPFDRMPQVFDPPAGFVATANGRTAPDDYPYPITLNWAAPYRTDRIYHALAHRSGLTPADMLALENDVSSDFDRVLAQRLAYAIDHAPGMSNGMWKAGEQTRLRQAADLLRTFDGRMSTDSAAAAIAYAVHQALWPALLGPKLGMDERQVNAIYLWGERDYALEQLLAHTPPRWLSPPYTNWDDLLAASVLHGLEAAKAPKDLAGWRYGQMHVVDLEHPVFGQFPLLARLLGMATGTGPQPQSGDTTTVKQVARTFGPSERFTTDFGDLDRSTLNLPAGQSGDPASAHFLDQFPHWLRGSTYPLPFSDNAVRKAAVHTVTLTPR